MKKIVLRFVLLPVLSVLLCSLCGCGFGSGSAQNKQSLEFTIISEECLPSELKTLIDERKEAPFQFTYSDKEALYVCIGYGMQETGGYSITVDEFCESDSAVFVKTSLLGPSAKDRQDGSPSCPYIVIQTAFLDKTVEFE